MLTYFIYLFTPEGVYLCTFLVSMDGRDDECVCKIFSIKNKLPSLAKRNKLNVGTILIKNGTISMKVGTIAVR